MGVMEKGKSVMEKSWNAVFRFCGNPALSTSPHPKDKIYQKTSHPQDRFVVVSSPPSHPQDKFLFYTHYP